MEEVRWALRPGPAEEVVETLCREAAVHPITARILARRGVCTPAEAQRFFRPSLENLHDPYLMRGMEEAVARIVQALKGGEGILISGDYDVDGITSTTLLVWMLRQCRAEGIDFFIPNRFVHGYGLTPKSVAAIAERGPGLVITVDNGVTAIQEIAALRAQGIDVVVTDHHSLSPQGLPDCILINPNQPDCAYPFKGLCGCGLALKLALALRARLRDLNWWQQHGLAEPNLRSQLDLVAIASVADVTPLRDENRTLVASGLQLLNRGPLRPGLEALRAENPAWRRSKETDARTIGYQIAPRINASGRLGDGALGVELLLAPAAAEACQFARKIEELNTRRRAVGEEMRRTAAQMLAAVDTPAPQGAVVVASEQFHQGVIGILASELTERYHLPAAVFARLGDSCRGSVRSVKGVDVVRAIGTCADLLDAWGGHPAAAGCTVPARNIAEFTRRFQAACAEQAATAAPPTLWLEDTLRVEHLSPALVQELESIAPFGEGNEQPRFLLAAEGALPPPKVFKERHLRWDLTHDLEMLGFNYAGRLPRTEQLEYRVRVGFNTFRGERKMRLLLDGYRRMEGLAAE